MKTKHVSRRFRRFVRANEAVSALEYAILVGVIAVGMAAALAAFESDISEALTAIGGIVDGTTISGSVTAKDN
jgi:Flp pilus assembly pilin Flp